MSIKQKQIVSILAAALAFPSAVAFSPSSAADTRHGAPASISTTLKYRNHEHDGLHLYDVDGERVALAQTNVKPAHRTTNGAASSRNSKVKASRRNNRNSAHAYGLHLYDVESDRTSLRVLLDPPAAPLIPKKNTTAAAARQLQTPEDRQASLRAASRSRSSGAPNRQRASPIVSLYTVQDYRDHVLHSSGENELCIVRFKAPWCQTCRTTNVAWERMASKLTKLSSTSPKNKVKFLSVELDGKEGTTALKDELEIEGVPQGVLHHPTLGISERKVKMNRSNLSVLKKNLERYCTFTRGEDGLQSGMLLDGLKE